MFQPSLNAISSSKPVKLAVDPFGFIICEASSGKSCSSLDFSDLLLTALPAVNFRAGMTVWNASDQSLASKYLSRISKTCKSASPGVAICVQLAWLTVKTFRVGRLAMYSPIGSRAVRIPIDSAFFWHRS